ncbi:MAG: MerR family transcriptional regulator [Synergistaceae bacterium]|jgi:DNA-binding transcriptional MerR regulator|nr:MerR family transcriptional regulator [Synergistaceae bacterium]
MKIGEFSEMFRLTPETVRFYINKGLLVPASRNERYAFSAQDVEDMELLQKLKRLRFSLSEIHRIVSLKRLSNFDSTDELNDYVSILKKQKKVLTRERGRLQETIAEIEREIAGAAGKHTGQAKRASGVPLAFLPYLACPHCQKGLSIKGCSIEKDQIVSGSLFCACGYQSGIQNGIVLGERGEVSIYDGPDLERNCYRMMSPGLITLMKKNYRWMLERLEKCGTKGKLVLEDFVNDYCFCHANFEAMDPSALYVITDKFPEIVAMYKNLIDKMNLEHQVLYIAAASHLLPLRDGCVDIYIDLATNEYAMFQQGYAMDALSRYFHERSSAVGIFWHFEDRCESLAELRRQYPDAFDRNFDLACFREYLGRCWQDVADFDYLGFVTDSGEEDSFSYHVVGEKLNLNSYFVRGFLPEGAV